MYSTHNERKSFIVKRLIRTLRNKICKYMMLLSKNVYIDKLDDIVNKYNNTYHSTIKTKPLDVKSSTYIDYSKEINNKDPKFKNGVINQAQYDLDREAAKISALSCDQLERYLTGKDLGYKPDVIHKVKFEYSPLG